MLWLKACPKCKGDLSMESDRYGTYVACAQCGYYLTTVEEAALRSRPRVVSPMRRVPEPAPRRKVMAA